MSERNGFAPGVPCWVDTWQSDGDALAGFYTGLFGWDAVRDEYSMFQLRGRHIAGFGGEAVGPPAWTTYVQVEDAEATAATVIDAGGTLVHDTFDSLEGGRIAIAADPSGGVFGIWQLGEHAGAQLVNEPGAWAMSVLSSPDPERAKAFYGAVFGWETESFGPATMFRLPGFVGGEPQQPVARDVVAVMMEGETARWTPDFWVHDAEAAAAKAGELGGSVLAPPAHTGVGTTGVLADPGGAVFSVTKIDVPASS